LFPLKSAFLEFEKPKEEGWAIQDWSVLEEGPNPSVGPEFGVTLWAGLRAKEKYENV
jgi:hypothetical protein